MPFASVGVRTATCCIPARLLAECVCAMTGHGPATDPLRGMGALRIWPGGMANARAIGDFGAGHLLISSPHITQVPARGILPICKPVTLWVDAPSGCDVTGTRVSCGCKIILNQTAEYTIWVAYCSLLSPVIMPANPTHWPCRRIDGTAVRCGARFRHGASGRTHNKQVS
jgi:hypothetical protein